jgi:hypothetical protein
LLLWLPVLCWHPAAAADCVIRMSAREAVPATALLDSMGVNTHFGFADSPYARRYPEVRAKLVALGLRHVRDVMNSHVSDLARLGITTTVLAEPNVDTPGGFRDRIKTLNAGQIAVDAVEGANEPDMFWRRLHISWQGEGYPEGPVLWQRDLFHALKSDPATAGLTVIGPSLGLAGLPSATPPAAWKGLWRFVDWGNFHPYPYNGNPYGPELQYGTLPSFFHNGTFPSVGLDEAPDFYRAYRGIYGSGPMAATETGYPTGAGFTSEALQAKYVVRLFLENFRLGIKRTYLYQLLDNIQGLGRHDPDTSFGLLRYDLSERPAYLAVGALNRMLRHSPSAEHVVPGDVRLTLIVSGFGDFPDPTRVHHLLLRRSNGTLLLLLWHETSGEDLSSHPRRQVQVSALPANLVVSRPLHIVADDLSKKGPTVGSATTIIRMLRFRVSDALAVVSLYL